MERGHSLTQEGGGGKRGGDNFLTRKDSGGGLLGPPSIAKKGGEYLPSTGESFLLKNWKVLPGEKKGGRKSGVTRKANGTSEWRGQKSPVTRGKPPGGKAIHPFNKRGGRKKKGHSSRSEKGDRREGPLTKKWGGGGGINCRKNGTPTRPVLEEKKEKTLNVPQKEVRPVPAKKRDPNNPKKETREKRETHEEEGGRKKEKGSSIYKEKQNNKRKRKEVKEKILVGFSDCALGRMQRREKKGGGKVVSLGKKKAKIV